ncbi:importin subunit beta-2 [Elsinoe australis]|uniref:Importin subunit beta-2 n=1 Tax=Elsinoe australis TaxID=40998 RepID=A0A4U7AUV3_9PEZI|nr:importin subunit beta-2 [Elsinoe australis]
MDWRPDPAALEQLTTLLAATLDARNKTKQKNAELTLKQITQNPDVANYLTYLTVTTSPAKGLSEHESTAARSAAGLMLKNHIRTAWKSISDSNKTFVRGHILAGLHDPNTSIRSYTGLVITEIVRQGGILAWTEVLSSLISLIENSDGSATPQAQDGAMGALSKICEDNKKALNKSYNGERPMDVLVPKLVDFSNSDNPKVRWQALATLNSFMVDHVPDAIQINAEHILQHLFQRAHDQHEEVRRYVCRLFTSLAGHFPQLMIPHFEGIVDYILTQQRGDPNSDLALDAAEFFFENGERQELHEAFAQYLPKIIPVLLESMRFDEEHQATLEAEAEEDAELEDREQDIKPQFAATKAEKGKTADSGAAPNGYAYEDDDSEGEIDEDDDLEDPEEEWNLRKCSAASLDYFAANFHELVFEATLPYLKDNLNHQAWANREAAVLTLGAIQSGCMEVVKPSLPELVPYLLTLLNDPTPVVRQITCWTLGRYSVWAAQLDGSGKKQFFEPMMEGLLNHMLDKNKKVQKAAISAFATLEEQAKYNLVPYGPIIAQQFGQCFDKYKDQNMYLLYDCVQTLSESLGPEMASPQMVDLLMPSLIKRWHLVQDQSQEMFPLLECLAYLATSMGPAFAPFAEPLFNRCIKIIRDNLEEGQATADRPAYEQPDKDFLVTSLDLLSAIIQALEHQQSESLVKSTNMFEVLAYCMQDSSNDVRQSAYALLGDSAINVFSQLQPYLDPIMKLLLQQLDLQLAREDRDTTYRVINNACWSAGEISMRAGGDLAPHVDELLAKLGLILFQQKIPPSLGENSAIAMGRLGFSYADKLAPHLASFAPRFLSVLQVVAYTDEKQHALQGFTNVVAANPSALEQCLVPYLGEIGTGILQEVPPPNGFKEVLQQYQGMISDFSSFLNNSLPEPQRHALKQTFNIQ